MKNIMPMAQLLNFCKYNVVTLIVRKSHMTHMLAVDRVPLMFLFAGLNIGVLFPEFSLNLKTLDPLDPLAT